MARVRSLVVVAVCSGCLSASAIASTTVFFDSCQIATLLNDGVTNDTISSSGYVFWYTRDKLFTGGTGQPIGRPVRIPWPDGVESQAVTTPAPGDTDTKARINVQRVDGEVFDFTAFTAHLLANTAGAGAAIEIMPLVNGEDAFPDPITFDVTGYYGQEFSYDQSPNPWGSTELLVGYDTYKVSLYVDFAMVALTFDSPVDDGACCLPDNSCGEMTVTACTDQGGTMQGIGTNCGCSACALPSAIPTTSEWGLAVMTLLVLVTASAVFRGPVVATCRQRR